MRKSFGFLSLNLIINIHLIIFRVDSKREENFNNCFNFANVLQRQIYKAQAQSHETAFGKIMKYQKIMHTLKIEDIMSMATLIWA